MAIPVPFSQGSGTVFELAKDILAQADRHAGSL